MCDMLWSDPDFINEGWKDNTQRGVSYNYGKDVINNFICKFDLDFICRSHQVI
jgi:serine/threonine-protein phosphatase PP1 catalytic subunit